MAQTAKHAHKKTKDFFFIPAASILLSLQKIRREKVENVPEKEDVFDKITPDACNHPPLIV
ncbi:MAG: hypothetical protein IJF49_08915 [Clostridia bacterium]|nr:hypothetical protein [Clostridia bacterium]